jgi:hypothetical protein
MAGKNTAVFGIYRDRQNSKAYGNVAILER